MNQSRYQTLAVTLFACLIAVCSSSYVSAQESEEEYPDAAFFVGEYTLIGKVLEGDSTFIGLLRLEREPDGSQIAQRVIGTDTITGTWGMEYAIGAEVRVIRVRWEREQRKYECTYQWSMDFDSYPRISGHCYESGMATDSPGMEVGFIIWPEWDDQENLKDGEEKSKDGEAPSENRQD